MSRFAKSIWKRVFLRGVGYADRHTDLERLYRVRDPWQMESPREQFRFEQTNKFIAEHLGHPESLLEIGCGEGHQSVYLERVCDRLLGVDVSDRAVTRAAERCPRSQFIAGDLYSTAQLDQRAPFDLVTACEVLYYMKDVRSAMDRMFSLGHAVLVSYYDGQAERLEPLLETYPNAQQETVECEGISWSFWIWRVQH